MAFALFSLLVEMPKIWLFYSCVNCTVIDAVVKIMKIYLVCVLLLAFNLLCACSSKTSGEVEITMTIQAVPATPLSNEPGQKTFLNDLGDSITLTQAYLVISSSVIQHRCDSTFSAMATDLIDLLLPQAYAHSSSAPTNIKYYIDVPYVIDLLIDDSIKNEVGIYKTLAGEFCGIDINLSQADEHAVNLPTSIDLVGKTLYIKGTYALSAASGGGTGNISITTSAALINRKLLMQPPIILNDNHLTDTVNVAVNFDLWFDSIGLAALESETLNPASTATNLSFSGSQINQLLQNISSSMHEL